MRRAGGRPGRWLAGPVPGCVMVVAALTALAPAAATEPVPGAARAACAPDAATAAGVAPYVAYRSAGELVFVSGQIGVDPAAPGPAPDFERQMRVALSRLDRVLAAAGSAPTEVLRATVYLADPADMAAMNRLYRAYFEDHRAPLPARSLVPGLDFGNGIAVEIDVVARRLPCD